MEFELSSDQNLLLTAFEALLARFDAQESTHGYVAYNAAFQAELSESGFLEIATQPGYGLLDAALLIEAAARCRHSVEIAASSLLAPLIGGLEPPVALAWGLGKPARYLDHAGTVCLFDGDGVIVGTPAPGDWEKVESVLAYPLAILRTVPRDAARCTGDVAAAVRRRALIGIAAEAAGLMRGALDQTVQYVKDRRQFGQPLGHFQAIQHRLAEDAQLVHACRSLAFQAAYEDDDRHASVACLYAQEAIRKIVHDCHQFSGAMGLTLEYPLHLWTYRLKFLQGEAGGRAEQARLVANRVWGRTTDKSATIKTEGMTNDILDFAR